MTVHKKRGRDRDRRGDDVKNKYGDRETERQRQTVGQKQRHEHRDMNKDTETIKD